MYTTVIASNIIFTISKQNIQNNVQYLAVQIEILTTNKFVDKWQIYFMKTYFPKVIVE